MKKMMEVRMGEDLVGWTSSFMQERNVRMVIDGVESEELEVNTGLPQGSSVSPILFIYINGVHEARDRAGLVRSLSFIDDVTWVAQGRSVAEVRVKLGEGHFLGPHRRSTFLGNQDGGDPFLPKPQALEGQGHEQVQVYSHQVPFNR